MRSEAFPEEKPKGVAGRPSIGRRVVVRRVGQAAAKQRINHRHARAAARVVQQSGVQAAKGLNVAPLRRVWQTLRIERKTTISSTTAQASYLACAVAVVKR